jgi:hypothetical protein
VVLHYTAGGGAAAREAAGRAHATLWFDDAVDGRTPRELRLSVAPAGEVRSISYVTWSN